VVGEIVCAWALIFFRCRNNFYPTFEPLTELTESLTLIHTLLFLDFLDPGCSGAMRICGEF
jgi:hypothetical protein